MVPLKIGIVGAGRMGKIRARTARAHPDCQVVCVFDVMHSEAQDLATEVGCVTCDSWELLIQRDDVDAIVVATPHKYLSPITIAAIRAGKRVFCEKPLGRNANEAEEIVDAVQVSAAADNVGHDSNTRVIVGYTLRHHPAVTRAKELVTSGAIGEPFYVRGRYGHGGRSGYEKEWRGNLELSGGGELLDQGVHLIDLSRWFLGEFCEVMGSVNNYFWNADTANAAAFDVPKRGAIHYQGGRIVSTCVEDNAFMLLKGVLGKTALLHVSWTQWKNLFSFEIFGANGFLLLEGLGGSYGPERLVLATRRETGPPEMQEFLFDPTVQPTTSGGVAPSTSATAGYWEEEWAEFVRIAKGIASFGNRHRSADLLDGYQSLRIVDAVYRSAAEKRFIELEEFPLPQNVNI
jgi:predicted dehydrogenase